MRVFRRFPAEIKLPFALRFGYVFTTKKTLFAGSKIILPIGHENFNCWREKKNEKQLNIMYWKKHSTYKVVLTLIASVIREGNLVSKTAQYKKRAFRDLAMKLANGNIPWLCNYFSFDQTWVINNEVRHVSYAYLRVNTHKN